MFWQLSHRVKESGILRTDKKESEKEGIIEKSERVEEKGQIGKVR